MTTARRWQLRAMRPEELTALYNDHIRRDFPSEERPHLSAMRRHVEKGLQEIYFLHDGHADAAYAVCAEANDIVLITLLAVFAGNRGRGHGTALLSLLKDRYQGKRAILLEVDDPGEAADDAERAVRQKRIAFYRRAGYLRLHGVVNQCFGVRLLMLALPLADQPQAVRKSAAADIQAVYRKILPKWLWPQVVTTDGADE